MSATAIRDRIGGAQQEVITSPQQWYAVCTFARHEKRVAARLASDGVEHFLPLYRSVRRWKDRRVVLDLPLFPGYVFVHMNLLNRLQVLREPGVSRFVEFGGIPASMPEEEILTVRKGLDQGGRAEPCPYLTAGKRVRITGGPFAGLNGIVVRRKGQSRIVLTLDLIQRSISAEFNPEDIEVFV